MEFLKNFDRNYNKIIEPYISYGNTFEEIKKEILNKLDINLDMMNYEKVNRETTKGFRMKYHRDNFMVRKVKNEILFLPFNNSKTSKFSLIWYKNEDFTGGTFQFINSKHIIPKKNMFIFFDSNQIHCVNKQLSGIRIVELFKFY